MDGISPGVFAHSGWGSNADGGYRNALTGGGKSRCCFRSWMAALTAAIRLSCFQTRRLALLAEKGAKKTGALQRRVQRGAALISIALVFRGLGGSLATFAVRFCSQN